MNNKIFSKSNLLKLIAFIGLSIIMILFLEPIIIHAVPVAAGLLALIAVIAVVKRKDSRKIIGPLLVMVIGAFLVALALSQLVSALGINFDFNVKEKLTAEEAGTTGTEILNNGRISETEDYVFYINPHPMDVSPSQPEDKLIRRNRDWTDRMELTDSPVSYFVVSDDWIYFVAASEGHHLYRMKYDGSDRHLVVDKYVTACAVSGGSIYYSTLEGLYKTDAEGKETMRLLSSEGVPTILGDWIYYSTSTKNLYRIRTDGTMDQLLLSDMTDIYDYYPTENSLYYIKMTSYPDDFGSRLILYRSGFNDDQAMEIITLENVVTAEFNNGYLYYQLYRGDGRLEKGLYRVNLDGSGTVRVNKVMIWELDSIQGDWMYILQYSGNRYRIRLDGSVGLKFE